MSTTLLEGLRDYLCGTLSTDDMMWLVGEMEEYVRKEGTPKPYTMEELQERIAKSERDAEEGRFRTHEEVFADIFKDELLEAV